MKSTHETRERWRELADNLARIAAPGSDASDIAGGLRSLLADLEEAERTISRQQTALDGHVAEINTLKADCDSLRAKKFTRFNGEECWIWQGEADHLESLVCPVVISPADLLAIFLIAAQAIQQRDALIPDALREAAKRKCIYDGLNKVWGGRLAELSEKLEEAETQAEANGDMLTSARHDLDAIREALGVSVEPHQSLSDRMLEAAACKASTAELLARIDTLERQLSSRPMVEKLDAPACVGNATFGIGVDAQLVIEAAQRYAEDA